jgi:hypothetical protein
VYFSGSIVLGHVGLLDAPTVKRWCDDVKGFVAGFPSDLELIRAAHRAIPNDVDEARDDTRRNEIRTLLMVKDLLHNPVTEVHLPKMTFFYGEFKSGSLYIELFDERGRCRGSLLARSASHAEASHVAEHPEEMIRALYYGYLADTGCPSGLMGTRTEE